MKKISKPYLRASILWRAWLGFLFQVIFCRAARFPPFDDQPRPVWPTQSSPSGENVSLMAPEAKPVTKGRTQPCSVPLMVSRNTRWMLERV